MNDPWSYDRSHEGPAGHKPERRGYFHQNKLASAPWRWAAGLIDWGIVFLMPAWFVTSVTNSADAGLIIGLIFAGFNSGYLAAKTTQSLGKRVFGIRMVWVKVDKNQEAYVCYVPVWVALVRIPLHYVCDWIPLAIGFWLIPVMSRNRGTVTDWATRCIHYRDHTVPRAIKLSGPDYRRDW